MKKYVESMTYLSLTSHWVMQNQKDYIRQSVQHLPQEVIYGQYAEDEISLVDLWIVIKKRKKTVLYSILFFTLLSLIFAFAKADKYQYKVTIETGAKVVDGELKKIEEPATTLAKLNESYIPLVLSEYANNSDSVHKIKLGIKARIPKDSQIIVLELKGKEDQEDIYIQLLNQSVKKISQDHQNIIRLIKKNIDIMFNDFSSQMLAYDDEIILLKSRLKRQGEVVSLIKQEINNTDNILKNAVDNKQKAISEAGNESAALTIMLLNSEIRKAQEKSASLKERLYVDVLETKGRLNKDIKDIKRKVESIRDQQSRLILEKESIMETKALVGPIKSLDKIGLGKTLIVISGVFLGLVFGVVLVFLKNFSQKVREAEGI